MHVQQLNRAIRPHPLLLPLTLCSANETSLTETPWMPASWVNSTTSRSLVHCEGRAFA